MKGEYYFMMLMSTYMILSWVRKEKYWMVGPNKEQLQFKYPKVLHNHYQWQFAIYPNK